MSSLQAQISKILTWSCVDGPGNRMVVFLQGCNFNCLACHNPHTIGRCDDCGDCIPACTRGALALREGKIAFDPALCDQCDACLDACPINANPMVQCLSVDEVLAQVRGHAAFVTGITLSGGEATMQLPFVRALFAAMAEDPALAHLTRFIDSNGYLGAAAWETVLPVTDGVMLDIKAFDPATHRYLSGRENARVLESAQLLQAAGKLYELRYLMAPGFTDTAEEAARLAAFVHELGGDVRVRLNLFRQHGVRGEAVAWPEMARDGAERFAERLQGQGVREVCLPVV